VRTDRLLLKWTPSSLFPNNYSRHPTTTQKAEAFHDKHLNRHAYINPPWRPKSSTTTTASLPHHCFLTPTNLELPVFSPYAQKTKLLLHTLGIQYQRVDQPPLIPRPDLEALGITFRRIPVLAVGKDVYCDSSLIFDVLLNHGLSNKQVQRAGPADKAWESWGAETFQDVLTIIPPSVLSETFVKDRQTVFPILARSDIGLLKASGLAELRSRMAFLEDSVLGQSSAGPFLGGKEVSVADMHILWAVRWALNDLGAGKEKGLGKEDFPRVWGAIEALPDVSKDASDIGGEEAKKIVEGGEYWAKEAGVDGGDPLGLGKGTKVVVESLE